MKAFNSILLTGLFIFSWFYLGAQTNMLIQSGGAVTVNGNTSITTVGFVCGTPLTDLRDGKTYNTVQIGTQCWFAQNLNIGVRTDNILEQANNGTIEKYCLYNDESYCNIYGGLYQWSELMDYSSASFTNPSERKGICPLGWHVPSDAEWLQLVNFLGGSEVAGGPLKEAGFDHWRSPNIGATNLSGFTALPAGFRGDDRTLNDNGLAYFWSTGQWYWKLSWYTAQVEYGPYNIFHGFTGRCLKD